MASILRFDNWENSDGASIATSDASGNLTFAGVGAGKILQVVTGTTSTEVTTTAGTMVTTGLTATITPTSVDSTILAFMSITCTIEAASTYLTTTIFRGTIASGTNLATPDPFLGLMYSASTTGGIRTHMTTFAPDTPATTSATTYTGAFNSTNGKVCKGSNSPAKMILMEVSA